MRVRCPQYSLNPPPHTHTHRQTRTHTRTQTRTYARTHTHLHTQSYFSVADPLKPHDEIHALANNFRYCPYRLAARLEREYMALAPQSTRELCVRLNAEFKRHEHPHGRTLSDVDRMAVAAAEAVYASLDTKQKIRYLISKCVVVACVCACVFGAHQSRRSAQPPTHPPSSSE